MQEKILHHNHGFN